MRIDITDNKGFQELRDKFKNLSDEIASVPDNAAASIAAAGRKDATKVEERLFSLGKRSEKGGNSKASMYSTSASVFDSGIGGYASSLGKKGNNRKLIYFSFENVARRSRSKRSVVAVRSKMSALFENDTKAYSSSSPLFRSGGNTKWGIQRVGTSRKGKKYFYSSFLSAIQKGIPSGIASAEKRIEKAIEKAKLEGNQ